MGGKNQGVNFTPIRRYRNVGFFGVINRRGSFRESGLGHEGQQCPEYAGRAAIICRG